MVSVSGRGGSGGANGDDGNLLPLLIIPGIMSSGLEVRKSCVGERYVGERVWLNPIALGKGKLAVGESFKARPSTRSSRGGKRPGVGEENDDDDSSFSSDNDEEEEDCEPELVEELDCKSPWLQHISLTSDGCTEREGNEIRPIPGLDGVDFLTDIAGIDVGASYVFGPIIELLRGVGYVEGKNIDAVPYDWRVPPKVLEERDGYFTKTMERIERMVSENNGTPVVLLCHSMGGKTGHYLLNFALHKKGPEAGREWIDAHVHTYMPLGAAHTGVPSIIASIFTAELNASLDPLLTATERMVFSRSLGSAVWLMPTALPSLERNAPPALLCKAEGKLTIEIVATRDDPIGDVNYLVANKHGTRTVNPFKVKVVYGRKGKKKESRNQGDAVVVRSGVARPVPTPADHNARKHSEIEPQYFELPCPKFVISTPASLMPTSRTRGDETDEDTKKSVLEPIQFVFMEKGDIRVHHLEKMNKVMEGLRRVDRGYTSAKLWNKAAKKAGKYKINLAMSTPIDDIDVHELMKAGEKGLMLTVPIYSRKDMTLRKMTPKAENRAIDMKVKITWEPPQCIGRDDPTNPIAAFPKDGGSLFAPVPKIRQEHEALVLRDVAKYEPMSGQALLRNEGLEDHHVALARDCYSPEADPVGPRHESSTGRPPVRRVYAIYGINVDTVVSTICKRVPANHENETALERQGRPRFMIDADTAQIPGPATTLGGHRLEKGTLLETSETPQINLLTGERLKKCGDGSCPYYCLQQPQAWVKELEELETEEGGDRVKIEEIEGAEHRAVLSDKRFHTLLVDYLTGRTVF